MPNIYSLNIKEKIKLFDCRNPLTNAREIWRLGTKNEWKLDASKCAFCSKICRESPWIFIPPRERNTGCTTCTWRSPWNEMGVAQPVFRLGLELKGHRQRGIYISLCIWKNTGWVRVLDSPFHLDYTCIFFPVWMRPSYWKFKLEISRQLFQYTNAYSLRKESISLKLHFDTHDKWKSCSCWFDPCFLWSI